MQVLLERIPQAARLNMVRGSKMDHMEWDVQELQVGEMQTQIFGSGSAEKRHYPLQRNAEWDATALHTFRAQQLQEKMRIFSRRA